jgi:hypothetical protein
MRKLLIAILLAALLLAVPAMIMHSQRLMIALADWSVATFTPYRLTLVEPVLRPLEGFIGAGEIHLYPAADDGPAFLSVLDLRAELSATDLYRGTLANATVAASQLTLYVSTRDRTADPTPRDWLDQLRWLPAELTVSRIHLVTETGNTVIFPLRDFKARRVADGYSAAADADYAGEALAVSLDVSGVEHSSSERRLSVDTKLIAPGSGSRIQLQGDLSASHRTLAYELQLQADYTDVDALLRGIENAPALAGHFRLHGHLQGDTRRASFTDAILSLNNMPTYGLEAGGSLSWDREAGTILDLQASGALASFTDALDWPYADLGALGRTRASARVLGELDAPHIERLVLRSENRNGLALTLRGRLDTDLTSFSDNELSVDLVGPALATLEPWIGTLPIEPGPFAASGRLTGSADGVALQDLVIEMGRPGEALLRVDGSADDVAGIATLGPDAVQGLSLGLALDSPDSARLGALLNLPLPPGFTVEGELALAGTSRLLQPVAGSLRMASSDIELELTPLGGLIRPFATTPLSGLRASARLSMSDTSALSQFLTRPIPSLGEVRGNALLKQSEGVLGLRDIDLGLVGSEQLLQLTGNIPDLGSFDGARLTTRFAGVSITTLLVTALQELHYEAPLGALQGNAEFSNIGGRWDLTRFRAESTPSGGPLELQSSGSIGDILGQPSVSGRLRYALRDTALIEALLGLQMKAASGAIDIDSAPGILTLSGSNRVGRSRLDLETKLGWEREAIATLEVVLTSDLVHLEDFGLQASVESDYRPTDQFEPGGFETALQRLLTVPPRLVSDVSLRVDGIRGANTVINSLDLHTTGENNRYTLRRLNVGYSDTVAELRGIVDLNASPPFVSVAGQGQGIPLRTLGRDLGMRSEVGGRLTLLGGLSAQGTSAGQLLASSNGSIALALEGGTFEGAAYDLLATDLLGWLFSGASRERLTRIDCSMARFSLRNGVASSDSLYMETPQMVATGSGKIDLVERRMDMELTPRSRTRTLQVPATVRLRGPLDQPRVSVSPVAAAMDASAELLSLLPRLARSVFGMNESAQARQPCEAAREAVTIAPQ